jgi:hypothetical protein
MTQERDERVFMVRMWREPRDDEFGGWRGVVLDVVENRRYYVSDFGEIGEFVARSLSDAGTESAP